MSFGFAKRMAHGKKGGPLLPPGGSELHGFVCPECMESFQSSTQLMSHFDSHQMPDTIEETDTKDVRSTRTGTLPYPQLLEEMSEHNNLLLEQLSDNTRRIYELETAVQMLTNGSSIPSDFVFSDKELERRIDVFLNEQTKFATLESELEANRGELQRNNLELDQMRSLLAQMEMTAESTAAEAETCGPNGDNASIREQETEKEMKVSLMLEREKLEKELSGCRRELQLTRDEVTNLKARLQTLKLEDEASKVSGLEVHLQTAHEEWRLTHCELTAPEARFVELKEKLDSFEPHSPYSVSVACQTDELKPKSLESEDRIEELTESLRAAQIELVQVRSTCEARMNELNAECCRLQTVCEQHVISRTQLQSEKDVLREQLGKLKEQFGNAETRTEVLVRQLSEAQGHWTTERLNLTSRVSELQQTVNDLRDKTKHLENQSVDLNLQLAKQQALISEAEVRLSEQAEKSKQKIDEAQAQLKLSKKEVESLLERLIAAEDKCVGHQDQMQSQIQEIDCLKKAIFELGRENQSLQMLRERVVNRQWTKDDDVVHCSNCQSEFSLTNRKHHCRQCGAIFCHSCSSHRASIAASKDPVRVCDSCYSELIGTGLH